MHLRVLLALVIIISPALAQERTVPGPDPAAKVGGTLRTTTSEPSTLNVYATTEGSARQIMQNVLEPLFTLSEQSTTALTPILAESWKVSEDGRTVVFRLRKDVTWSDGAPFTADDVVFTYEVQADPDAREHLSIKFEDIERVRRVDDHTVEVRFAGRYWKGFLAFGSTLFVLPRHWYL